MAIPSEIFSFTTPMAAKKCNTDRLAQRVTVFVTDFIRNTYGFLTPDHVEQLRTFRNEVEDNYPACGMIPTPWQTKEDTKLSDGSASETEEDDMADQGGLWHHSNQEKNKGAFRFKSRHL